VRVRRIAYALVALEVLVAAEVAGSSSGTATTVRAGLAFTRFAGPTRSSVWVADADGSHARRLAADAYGGILSPDGRRVAYFAAERGKWWPRSARPVLHVRSVAGGKPRRIGRVFGIWSPDGTRLAVSDGKALYLADPESGRRRRLASAHVYQGGIGFSPRGDRLAFAGTNGKVGRAYRSDVFVVRLSDLEVVQLTHDGHGDAPVWGRGWIVYRSFHFAGDWSIGRLRLMRPDGSGERSFARGDERVSRAMRGLDPLELSADGTRLLACAAAEFGCAPVAFTVPGGERYDLGARLRRTVVRVHELATAADLAPSGRDVLVDVGPFDGDDGHRAYAIPFRGGEPRLLTRDATSPSWP
jgi:Tol biopolymer transport system component